MLYEVITIRAGASICYDIRFPELARTLSLNGAQIMFVITSYSIHYTKLYEIAAIQHRYRGRPGYLPMNESTGDRFCHGAGAVEADRTWIWSAFVLVSDHGMTSSVDN